MSSLATWGANTIVVVVANRVVVGTKACQGGSRSLSGQDCFLGDVSGVARWFYRWSSTRSGLGVVAFLSVELRGIVISPSIATGTGLGRPEVVSLISIVTPVVIVGGTSPTSARESSSGTTSGATAPGVAASGRCEDVSSLYLALDVTDHILGCSGFI